MNATAAAPRASRTRRIAGALAAAAALAGSGGAAHAGDVRWNIGIHLPLPPLPGVVVRPAPVYAPPPVVYAPPRRVYAPPPAVYEDVYGPSYGEYGGPAVVTYERYPRYRHYPRYGYRSVEPAPIYVQPRVVVRPLPPRRHHWDRWD